MPRLSDSQFAEYGFHAQKTPSGTNVLVTKSHPPGSAGATGMLHEERHEPIGSMRIKTDTGGDRNWLQGEINRGAMNPNTEKPLAHGQAEDPETGQQHWTEGNMGPNLSRVGWLGMQEGTPKTVLKGMMALGVAVHGSVPVADFELSQYGAKIAQGAARKYGIKGHPKNPEMKQDFRYAESPDESPDPDDPHFAGYAQEEVEYAAQQMQGLSRQYPTRAGGGGGFRADRWQTFSAAQTHGITQDVERDLGKRLRVDPRVPVHPSQGKLWGQQTML